MQELDKPGGQRCRHQRHNKGCLVYHQSPDFPLSCALWSCRWLVDADTAALARPDRAHYVVDIVPDTVQLRDEASGATTEIAVIQVWVDPAYPQAWRDPALLAYLQDQATRHRTAAVVRYGQREGFGLLPPALSGDGRWHEMRGSARMDVGIVAALRNAGVLPEPA